MNKRLKELVKHTGYVLASDHENCGDMVEDAFVERFSELLIKECARISSEVDETMTGQGEASAEAFKEYFGVK